MKLRLPNSRISGKTVTRSESVLGYFFGPSGVMIMTCILSGYLNVYYTDVLDIGHIAGGWFISAFPLIVKAIDAFTFIIMGRIIDRHTSLQGKARPWIFMSAPLMSISMILLFAMPQMNDAVTAVWIFVSYNLFYSVAYTAYNTAHTLLVPLSSYDPAERSRLSVVSNGPAMITGTIVSVLFPTLVMPHIGIDQASWIAVMTAVAIVALPIVLCEYFFTKERVIDRHTTTENAPFSSQFKSCAHSGKWRAFMAYTLITGIANCISGTAVFYYCNWVLGQYNDGYTQMLFYAVGNAPLGLGILFANRICARFGRQRVMRYGYILSAVGIIICLTAPTSLPTVLIGQVIKAIGLIPSAFMGGAILSDALNDTERVCGARMDGFTSSFYNVLGTVATGIALTLMNTGLNICGYISPSAEILTQPDSVRQFIIFAALGIHLIAYPAAAWLCRRL